MSEVAVVGAGTAGLTAAVRLAQAGRRVLVVARGVGSTHLAPATIDVLGFDPDPVASPADALAPFAARNPDHPYAHVEPNDVAAALVWFVETVAELGYAGGIDRNLLLPSAIGTLRPSAAVPASMRDGEVTSGGPVLLAGFRRLKDFYPALAAANLAAAAPVAARAVELETSPLPDADVGTLRYARALDEERGLRGVLVRELRAHLEPGERVGLPALLGLRRHALVLEELRQALGTPVFEVPTLPPSIPGMRLYAALTEALRRAGGRIVVGSAVVGAETAGDRIAALVVEAAGRRRSLPVDHVVLATGGFASGALELDSHGVLHETVLGLPVAGAADPPFVADYFAEQPLARAGLAVDAALRPVDEEGRVVYANLHAAGAVIGGAAPWRERSGEGISLATGWRAAAAVLEEASATLGRAR